MREVEGEEEDMECGRGIERGGWEIEGGNDRSGIIYTANILVPSTNVYIVYIQKLLL
jgi:hypothetical protein